ncbi:hypothetical protein [Lacihabitans sp. LS3-19]|uniref:hypothetical protein n=1 Tax=Lacihabitans sp. LS3-19 TaxID=2487335 RepID=UPI0020CE85AA|nr:hypothetical protein [Lacihabitans sp. LS3-19]
MKNLIIAIFFLTFLSFKTFASVIVKNGLTQIHELSTHSQKEGKVVLQNIGTKPENIKVYFNDLTSNCAGTVNYASPGQNIRSLYPFMDVATTDYTLQPGEEYELTYQIDLNRNQFESGSLWVLMMIEIVDPISKNTSSSGLEIGSKIRYAVQIIANIGQKNAELINFSNVKLGKDINENRVLEASLENGGKYLVIPNVNIQIFDAQGIKVKDVAVPAKKIYPLNCQNFSLPIADLPKGKYQAVLLADYLEESIGVNLDLEL